VILEPTENQRQNMPVIITIEEVVCPLFPVYKCLLVFGLFEDTEVHDDKEEALETKLLSMHSILAAGAIA
jgi:hypothetical protein